jgi:hypothetical protein
MFSAFFGHYLLNKGVVTKEELTHVLDRQKNVRLMLGVLAINAGYMNAKQVDEVHYIQNLKDQRFGEIAVSKGYLTNDQLLVLLGQQKAEHLILAQTLIDDGIMTMQTFEQEILLYKIAHGLDDHQFEAIKKGDVDVVMTAFLAFEKTGMSEFYIDFVTLFVKNIIRFIDRNVYIDRVERIDSILEKHLFEQDIIGTETLLTAYSGDDAAILDVASKHAGELLESIDAYAIDSACEFINLTNGLFVVNESDRGNQLSLTIQKYVKNASIPENKKLYRIPIHITQGVLNLYIGH